MSALAHPLVTAPPAALAASRARPATRDDTVARDDTELSDDALEHVVGGLARRWPGGAVPLLSHR